MQILRSAPDRNQFGRYVASLFGLIALICFYQPWVSASLPSVGDAALTGMDLARGEAARRVDEATFGKSVRPGAAGAAGATVAPGSAIGGLVLPTRVATVVPGAVVGGLTVPTRVPTVAANTGGAPAAASAGGLTLPTRVPTVAAAGGAPVSAGALAASSVAATSQANGTRAAGTAPSAPAPDELPQTILYFVPLAAAGLAIFAAIWDRLGDPRDRLFGKLWTIILSAGGTLVVGYVFFKVATAPSSNNLLAPGAAMGAQWGLLVALAAFLLSAVSLAVAWTAKVRPRGLAPHPFTLPAVSPSTR